MSSEIYEAACRYAELGLAVIPLKRETNTPPIRYKQIERDGGMPAADLRRHFADDRYNIGLLTGSASRGVMGVDVDSYRALQFLESRHPKLFKSGPAAISPTGWHFFFHAPEGERATRTFRVGDRKRSPICHLKGDGNYITLAPSYRQTPRGPKEYRWIRQLPANLSSLPTIHPQELLPYAQLAPVSSISSYYYSPVGGGRLHWVRSSGWLLTPVPYDISRGDRVPGLRHCLAWYGFSRACSAMPLR